MQSPNSFRAVAQTDSVVGAKDKQRKKVSRTTMDADGYLGAFPFSSFFFFVSFVCGAML